MTHLRFTAAAALLLASTARADLRTFDVDPQYQQEVFAALTDVLTPDPQRGLIMEAHGRVELLPSGQILVNADAATLEQVERVLEAIRARSAPSSPRVSLRYWAVLGTRQNDAQANVGSPPPPVLDDVLSELRRLHGEITFRVIGAAAVATNSGQLGAVQGAPLSVEQTAYVQGDTLNITVSLELTSSSGVPTSQRVQIGGIDLRTTLERGEFFVLGESLVQSLPYGYDGPVFYIVHWEE